jgi:flagellar biogenesis protein FliO
MRNDVPPGFWTAYAVKLAVVALVLGALYALARRLGRGRHDFAGRRRVSIIGSVVLSQHAAVWVLRAGRRYFLLGGGNAGVSTLAELTPADLEPESRDELRR